MENAEQSIREIQKGLLCWYDFKPYSRVLYIGSQGDALWETLREHQLEAQCVTVPQSCESGWLSEHKEMYDYLISVADLEMCEQPGEVLKLWKGLLKADGRMLLGMNNRLGLRYFCGDRDPYTRRSFDGVENYHRTYARSTDTFYGRMYSQAEIRKLLWDAGWKSFQFFSVISDLKNPAMIFSEDYLPNEDLSNRVFPMYNYPDTVFLEEEVLYQGLMENGMFHQMANAYLVECSLSNELSQVCQITCSVDRGPERAFLTVIRKDDVVEKRAVNPEGRKSLEQLWKNCQKLKEHGLQIVDAEVENGVYRMPYVKAEVGHLYLKRLLQTDKKEFLKAMDHFRDLILQSSEIVDADKEDGEGAMLREGYLDMVPLNSFFVDGEFVFYDQEFCGENYPANAVIYRMVATFYSGNEAAQRIVPMVELLERYGLCEKLEKWQRMQADFLFDLWREKELRVYHEEYRRNFMVVNSNRQRINYSEYDYQRLFVDIFHDTDERKLILFGSGAFARRFIAMYGREHPVYAIVDNDKSRHGKTVEGIVVQSPAVLEEMEAGEYKVLICIRSYLSVARQLEEKGIKDYSIFDSNRDYPRKENPKRKIESPALDADATPKKYHTGYIAGVFDLFHVGHLNMFKRAKEQCDYLIVGVVTDAGVRKNKKVDPFVPFEERLEMVRSCQYVDEAVKIPENYGGTRDAWRMYHFDVQFSGSDYVNDATWLAEKEFLEKHGAELVFFPYTEHTSSTKLKAMIEKKLL